MRPARIPSTPQPSQSGAGTTGLNNGEPAVGLLSPRYPNPLCNGIAGWTSSVDPSGPQYFPQPRLIFPAPVQIGANAVNTSIPDVNGVPPPARNKVSSVKAGVSNSIGAAATYTATPRQAGRIARCRDTDAPIWKQ
jgi:hypothetical protein